MSQSLRSAHATAGFVQKHQTKFKHILAEELCTLSRTFLRTKNSVEVFNGGIYFVHSYTQLLLTFIHETDDNSEGKKIPINSGIKTGDNLDGKRRRRCRETRRQSGFREGENRCVRGRWGGGGVG